jgi:hypothetical protein
MKSLKELLTIKSDYVDQKKDFLKDIILNGEFNMDNDIIVQGETKKVVDTLIKFLND